MASRIDDTVVEEPDPLHELDPRFPNFWASKTNMAALRDKRGMHNRVVRDRGEEEAKKTIRRVFDQLELPCCLVHPQDHSTVTQLENG